MDVAMKAVAFVVALLILLVGVAGLVAPSSIVALAGLFASSGAFYLLAAIRIAFGTLLIAAAPTSRAPRGVRLLGVVVVALGLAAAFAGYAALGEADAAIAAWRHDDSLVIRLTCVLPIAIGGFVAWACAPGAPDS
jgi:hypothetical protein